MTSSTNRRLFSLLLMAGLALGTCLASWAAGSGAPARAATLLTATPAARTTVANMPISFSLLPHDQPAGSPLLTVGLMPGKGRTYAQVLIANQGTFQVDTQGLLTFSPMPDFTGIAQITYVLRDNAGHLSAPAVVTVFVEPTSIVPASTFRAPASVPASAALTLYPNPASDFVALDLRPVVAGTYEAVVYDAAGHRAVRQAVSAGAVDVLHLSNLAAGRYRVEVCGTTTIGTPLRLSQTLVKQ